MAIISRYGARAEGWSPHAEVALLARILARVGYDDPTGRITHRQADGTFLATPFGTLLWDELRATDIARVDSEGNVLEGKGPVSITLDLHLALHRARPDVGVIVHSHPFWSSIWGAVGRVPPVFDHGGARTNRDIAVYDDNKQTGDRSADNARFIAALGDAGTMLQQLHGTLVLGETIAQAHHRALWLERRCQIAWHVEALGAIEGLRAATASHISGQDRPVPPFGVFAAMARRELRLDPSILE